MATRKKSNTFGPFEVKKADDMIVTLGRGEKIKLTYNESKPASIKFASFQQPGGGEVRVDAALLVQIGMMLQTVDRNKRFVCQFHGSYEAPNARRQDAACPNCHAAKVDLVENAIDSHQLEEDDA